MKKEAIAHISDNGYEQPVREHSENTASLSRSFSIAELQDICYAAGLLHDVGKYMDTFQQHIRGCSTKVEHSICGALEIKKQYGNSPLALLLELCIAGHHSGIPNCGTNADSADSSSLYGRLKRECGDYSQYQNELDIPSLDAEHFQEYLLNGCKTREDVVEKFAFLVRYCFSCLTDADSLDTRASMRIPEPPPLRHDFQACAFDLDQAIANFQNATALQKARRRLQDQAAHNISAYSEIYLMNMPTGSGKTLASMRCALKRMTDTDCEKKRIIYVIPYNSIIDQTVETFEKLFGEHTDILRHQSSFSYEERDDITEDDRQAAMYACENWDAGIVVTTAVQFFESLYGNKRGKLRKVHNLANSIIIFDEAHLMPREYLQPCLKGIAHITKYLHSEVILLTATMPDFKKLIRRYALSDATVHNLITDTSDFVLFKTNAYTFLGLISDEYLVTKAAQSAASLIVTNSRKGAAEIYRLCSGKKYHLSTYMTAYDRSNVIHEIKTELAKLYRDYPDLSLVPEDRKIVVVSTSLIEAGVDLDFAYAFRELTGLDSILQTGGRCNREGKRSMGNVFVFERNSANALRPEQSIAKGIFSEFEDVSSNEAINAYFDRLLYTEKEKIVDKSISNHCKKINLIPFRTYSEDFKIIDDTKMVSVAVCRDAFSEGLLENLKRTGLIHTRSIQKYCCSVYLNEFNELLSQHVLEDYGSGVYFLTNPDYYSPETGLTLEGKDLFI